MYDIKKTKIQMTQGNLESCDGLIDPFEIFLIPLHKVLLCYN